MWTLLTDFGTTILGTLGDISPIVILILFYQISVLKQPIPQLKRVIIGGVYVVIGLSLFLLGLEKALFPLGDLMAKQLTATVLDEDMAGYIPDWTAYYLVYIFAFMIGFATTIAEPSLIAVAIKAGEVSAGTISVWGLRLTVALGVAIALSVGTYRIVSGTPIYLYILVGYIVVIIQTIFAPKDIIALAYDSGGVTTSTVTVPLVAALGLGLSSNVPGRNPAIDGFGLIAFASLFPIISVLGYAQLIQWNTKFKRTKRNIK